MTSNPPSPGFTDLPATWPSHAAQAAQVPWTRVWSPELYDNPGAEPATDAATVGQQLAATLLSTQGLYVYDHRAKQMLFVSAGVERLLGCPPEVFTMEFHYGIIHPDDQAIVTEATVLVNQYVIAHPDDSLADFVFSVDYRIRHAQGQWRRVLRQNFALKREVNGALIAVAGLLTDITAHKHTHDVRFHVNRPDFADFVRRHRPAAPVLTLREQEVLTLVLQGHTSAEIARQLHISPATAETHRRNLRRKTSSSSLHHLLQHLDEA